MISRDTDLESALLELKQAHAIVMGERDAALAKVERLESELATWKNCHGAAADRIEQLEGALRNIAAISIVGGQSYEIAVAELAAADGQQQPVESMEGKHECAQCGLKFSTLAHWSFHEEQCDELRPDQEPALAAKDRDLADANHILLAANASADAFKRVADARAKQIEALEQQLAQVDIAVELLVTARKVNQSTVDTAMVIASGLTMPSGIGG